MKLKTFLPSLLAIILITQFSFGAGKFSKTTTIQNIKAAITGETTASAKYAAYSKQAKKEGLAKIALLFEAASKSEYIHANNHRAVLEQLGEKMDKITPTYEVKSTKENLEDAVKGESYEVATMYPDFIKAANDEGVNIAMISFNYAFQTEKKHKAMYENALDKFNSGKANELSSLYMVCPTCGNTYDSQAPKRCGISMTPRERFLNFKS